MPAALELPTAPASKQAEPAQERDIRLVMRGKCFTLPCEAARRFPSALLASLVDHEDKLLVGSGPIRLAVDRDPAQFEQIFELYKTGELRPRAHSDLANALALRAELDFWQLPDGALPLAMRLRFKALAASSELVQRSRMVEQMTPYLEAQAAARRVHASFAFRYAGEGRRLRLVAFPADQSDAQPPVQPGGCYAVEYPDSAFVAAALQEAGFTSLEWERQGGFPVKVLGMHSAYSSHVTGSILTVRWDSEP